MTAQPKVLLAARYGRDFECKVDAAYGLLRAVDNIGAADLPAAEQRFSKLVQVR
jgi:hypothetical protein